MVANPLPLMEDLGSEEPHEAVVDSSLSNNPSRFLAIESTPVNPRTLIVYPSQVRLPPRWKWSRENELCIFENEDGTRILKSIAVRGGSCRFFMKHNEIFPSGINNDFLSNNELQNIFWEFDALKDCPGVKDPLLLKVEEATFGIKKTSYWRSTLCLRFAGKGICKKCGDLRKTLKYKFGRMDRLAQRKQRKSFGKQLLERKLQRKSNALLVQSNTIKTYLNKV